MSACRGRSQSPQTPNPTPASVRSRLQGSQLVSYNENFHIPIWGSDPASEFQIWTPSCLHPAAPFEHLVSWCLKVSLASISNEPQWDFSKSVLFFFSTTPAPHQSCLQARFQQLVMCSLFLSPIYNSVASLIISLLAQNSNSLPPPHITFHLKPFLPSLGFSPSSFLSAFRKQPNP